MEISGHACRYTGEQTGRQVPKKKVQITEMTRNKLAESWWEVSA